MSLIKAGSSLELWTILSIISGVCIWLESKYKWASKISGALLALIFALILSNLNIIPVESSVYDIVWGFVVPLAIPLLLLRTDMKKIMKESKRVMGIFLISSLGTVLGGLIGFFLLRNKIPEVAKISSMMTGSYIGGGINFVALSDSLKVPADLISATVVADNLMTVITMVTLISIPSILFFRKIFPSFYEKTNSKNNEAAVEVIKTPKQGMYLKDLAFSIAISFAIVTVSTLIAKFLAQVIPTTNIFYLVLNGLFGNKYLILTTITMIVATIFSKPLSKINGADDLGTFLIYYFFAVIGIPASVILLITKAGFIFLLCLIMVIVNILVTLLGGKLFKFSLEEVLLTSNATIGGPTTAAAMAVSKGWDSLIAPFILAGTFGYVIGNYLGILIWNLLSLI